MIYVNTTTSNFPRVFQFLFEAISVLPSYPNSSYKSLYINFFCFFSEAPHWGSTNRLQFKSSLKTLLFGRDMLLVGAADKLVELAL